MSSEPHPPEHQESPWLWTGLSVGSIALHAGLLLLLGGRGLTLQPSAPSRSGDWVPITLWSAAPNASAPSSAAAAPNTPPATSTSPVPVAPQTSPNSAPNPDPPQPNPDAKTDSSNPQPNPNPSPNPQSSPQPAPTPSTAEPKPNPNPTHTPGDAAGGNPGNTDQSSSGFGVGFEWPQDICYVNSPEICTADPIDRRADTQTKPTSTQVTRLLNDLGLRVTTLTQIQTVIVVETDGKTTVTLTENNSKTTKVLQGNLTVAQAEILAPKLIALYDFSPTLREGQATEYGYTVTLTITPNN
ncbi:MAG: hypothetical protein ACPGVO_15570 [Spirulinaceae cyanobacterium]